MSFEHEPVQERWIPAPAEPLIVPSVNGDETDPQFDVRLAVRLPGTDAVVETFWRVRYPESRRPGGFTDTWTRNWLRVELIDVRRVEESHADAREAADTAHAPQPAESGWALGRALAHVGPGWWPLVRETFAITEAIPGAKVQRVGRECGTYEAVLLHPDSFRSGEVFGPSLRSLTERSRRLCEACGGSVQYPPAGNCVWRNYCQACMAQLHALRGEHPLEAERYLWMEVLAVGGLPPSR